MNPKMTAKEAAHFLGVSPKQVHRMLIDADLPYYKAQNSAIYFGYQTTKSLFRLNRSSKTIAFQIVKGGTGKTSLAGAVAACANLYGFKVLCIDLDQQGNLTSSFNVNPENLPVMIDILAEGYNYQDAIAHVYPGLDLLASRIENALLDEVIKIKNLELDLVYKLELNKLEQEYDLIIIDCPPSLGQSVAAVALAADIVVVPVVAENFALSGLKATCTAVQELEQTYSAALNFSIVLNKYDARTFLSQDTLQVLAKHPLYQQYVCKNYVRTSTEFPNAIAKGETIFDNLKTTIAKADINNLTKELLGLSKKAIEKVPSMQAAEL